MNWNNSTGLAAARRTFTNGDVAVMNHGDAIWDEMTYRWEGFSKRDIVESLMKSHGYTEQTATHYVSAFFAYCRAAPEDFNGPASRLVKVGNRYQLLDEPN